MTAIRKNVENLVAEVALLVVGWLVCISVLAGAYRRRVASQFEISASTFSA
jgi:hypothetical protein